jgi:hypothetical protein
METKKFIIFFIDNIYCSIHDKSNRLGQEPKNLIEEDPFSFEVCQYILKRFENEKEIECVLFVSQRPGNEWNEKFLNFKTYEEIEEMNKFIINYKNQILYSFQICTYNGNIIIGNFNLFSKYKEEEYEFHDKLLINKKIEKLTKWFTIYVPRWNKESWNKLYEWILNLQK